MKRSPTPMRLSSFHSVSAISAKSVSVALLIESGGFSTHSGAVASFICLSLWIPGAELFEGLRVYSDLRVLFTVQSSSLYLYVQNVRR